MTIGQQDSRNWCVDCTFLLSCCPIVLLSYHPLLPPLINGGCRRIDNRCGLYHWLRNHRCRYGCDDVMHQIHDACRKAESIVMVMVTTTMVCWRRRWRRSMCMMCMLRSAVVSVVDGSAAASSMSSWSAATRTGSGECCAAKCDSSDCRHDEFLVVVHSAPSLSFCFVIGARTSRAYI